MPSFNKVSKLAFLSWQTVLNAISAVAHLNYQTIGELGIQTIAPEKNFPLSPWLGLGLGLVLGLGSNFPPGQLPRTVEL